MIEDSKFARPIFVVGAPRSGTTLFQYMLRSHPNISLPTAESHFMIPLFRNEREFGDLNKKENIRKVLEFMYKKSHGFLEEDLQGMTFDINELTDEFFLTKRNSLVSIVRGLFEKNAEGERKKRWGDKTPYYVLHMELLLEKFPDAQFIHLIRDGRDVALSLFNRRHDFQVYNTYMAAKYWEIYVEIGRETGKKLGGDRYHEVFFEELLEQPSEVMQGVCEFLKEPYTEKLVDYEKSGEAGKTPLLQQPIQKSNKNKWKKILTENQVSIFENAVGNTLGACGYSLLSSEKKIPFIKKLIYRAHNLLATYWHLFIKSRGRARLQKKNYSTWVDSI